MVRKSFFSRILRRKTTTNHKSRATVLPRSKKASEKAGGVATAERPRAAERAAGKVPLSEVTGEVGGAEPRAKVKPTATPRVAPEPEIVDVPPVADDVTPGGAAKPARPRPAEHQGADVPPLAGRRACSRTLGRLRPTAYVRRRRRYIAWRQPRRDGTKKKGNDGGNKS